MSVALTGFIALASRGGDGYTHATRDSCPDTYSKFYIGWCGVVEDEATALAVKAFVASYEGQLFPICRACVTAIEAAHRPQTALVDCAVEGL